MTDNVAASSGPLAFLDRLRRMLDCVSYDWLALPLRFAAAVVFWNSGQTKIASWDSTLFLFANEYNVPIIPPDIAAYLATAVELSTPVLLVLGLMTRPAALVLIGMVAVIQMFVYPQAWPTHIQWLAILFMLLFRGAGRFSLDNALMCWRGRQV